MRGVNKVIIVGHLGQDPEVRFLPSGVAVATLSIATSEQWTDKQSGQRQERTEWHRVVLFDKLAEIAQQYLRKGSRVYVEGSIHTRKWQDQSGQDRYSTEIKGRDMQMLGESGQGGQQSQRPAQQQQQQSPAQGAAPTQQPSGGEFDDEIPF